MGPVVSFSFAPDKFSYPVTFTVTEVVDVVILCVWITMLSPSAANADVGSSEKSIMIAKSRLMVRYFCIGGPPKVRYALYG